VSLLLDEIALAAARLAEAGVESPRAEAELIAAHVHGVRRTELHTVPMRRLTRASGRGSGAAPPASRCSTSRGGPTSATWSSRSARVYSCHARNRGDDGLAIDRLREMDVAEPVVVDLGTGSGAIALAIAQEVPRARAHAVEADPIARGWTEKNVARVASAAPTPGPGDTAQC